MNSAMAQDAGKTVKVGRSAARCGGKTDQRATLVGLGLNRPGRVSELADTPAMRGMIAKVAHLIEVRGSNLRSSCAAYVPIAGQARP